MTPLIAYPTGDEYPEFFTGYIGQLRNQPDVIAALEQQRSVIAALAAVPDERASYRYADGKWSVKEVVSHMTDAERIFSYRLLRIARGDETPLPAFDENKYVASSHAADRQLSDLASEMAVVRDSSLALVRSLDARDLDNRGMVRAGAISARASVFVLAGHFAHHANILKERYRINLP